MQGSLGLFRGEKKSLGGGGAQLQMPAFVHVVQA